MLAIDLLNSKIIGIITEDEEAEIVKGLIVELPNGELVNVIADGDFAGWHYINFEKDDNEN